MKKLVLGITACLTLATTILVSCNKTEKEQNTPHTEALKKMSAKFGYTDFPKNENGMLVFRDDAQLDKYIDFLDRATDAIDSTDDTQDEHSVLLDIEKGQGFNSLRNVTHAAYEAQDAKGWASPEAIPDEHFITSPEMRSVLNNNLEVRIGTDILHYVNKDISVRVEATNARMLAQYRSLSTSATLDQVRFIDPRVNSSSVNFVDVDGSLIVFGKGTEPKPTGTDFVVSPYITFPDKCNNPMLAEFSGLGLRNAQGYFSGSCVIDYGDNSQLQTKYTSITTAGIRVPNFQHTYPHPGQYIVKIKGYYAGGGLVEAIQKTITVGVGGCAASYKGTDWHYGYISSTVAWGGKLEMQSVSTNTSNERGKLYAYTKLVKQNADGSWSGFKGKIFTRLGCHAQEINNCGHEIDNMVGEGYDNNKKDNVVHRTGLTPFAWEMAFAQHTYIDNNGEHTIWSELRTCQ